MNTSRFSRGVLIASVGFLGGLIATAAPPPVSSPEGTLTSYVEGKNSLIYPPRSARAQKVEFDTADKQMIYEPDTPFRAFFSSHAADFQAGKLDYAKTTILGDVIAALRNKQYIRSMVRDVIEQDLEAFDLTGIGAPTGKEEKKAKQTRVANLLIDGVTLILERENYPELRDEDIDRILARLTDAGDIDPTDELGKQASAAWKKFVLPDHSRQLVWELRQALAERRSLKSIIAEAVARRPELFRGASSPVGPMREAQGLVEKFVKENLEATNLSDLADGKKSLWEAVLRRLNDPDGQALRRPGTSDKLTDEELAVLGKRWREDLTALLDKGTALDKAVKETLAARRLNLVAKTNSDTDIKNWVDKLIKRPALAEAHARLNRDAPALKTAVETLATAQSAALLAEQTLATNRVHADATVSTLLAILPRFGDARVALKQAYEPLTGKVNDQKLLDVVQEALANLPGAGADTNKLQTLGGNIKTAVEDLGRLKDRYDFEDALGVKLLTESGVAFKANLAPEQLGAQQTAARQLRKPAERFTEFTKEELAWGEKLVEQLNEFAGLLQAPPASASAKLNAAGKRLRDDWASKAAESQRSRGNGISTRNEVVGYLKSTPAIDESLKNFDTAAIEKQSKTEAKNAANKDADTRKAAFADSEAIFTKAVEEELNLLRPSFPAGQDFEALVAEVKARIQAAYAPARLGTSGTIPTLEQTLTDGFKGLANDTSDTEQRGLARLLKAFGDSPSLIKSDEPVLKAWLKTGKLSFGNAEFGKKAADLIPAKFLASLAAKPAADAAKPDTVTSVLKAALEDPEISYLFGSGDANARAMEAFKGEFYNAFKHRLPEALAAEREADYDYWWLSFYPKAVAVGANRFQGQSILEVGFNENIVPVEQYHRWLEDQELGDGKTEDEFGHRIRLAAGVLNDFLAALDSSMLSDRFPGLREDIQQSLSVLTSRPQGASGGNLASYRGGMSNLIHLALARDEASLTMNLPIDNGRLNRVVQQAQRQSTPPKTNAQAQRQPLPPSKTNTQAPAQSSPETPPDPIRGYFVCATNLIYQTNDSYFVKAVRENLMGSFEAEARVGLEWVDLDIRHVAFCALTASLRNAALPEKVQLYSAAFWGDSRRFATEFTVFDTNVLHRAIPNHAVRSNLDEAKYVVPFERTAETLQLARYLLLRGASDYGVGLLLERYQEFIGVYIPKLPALIKALKGNETDQSGSGRLGLTFSALAVRSLEQEEALRKSRATNELNRLTRDYEDAREALNKRLAAELEELERQQKPQVETSVSGPAELELGLARIESTYKALRLKSPEERNLAVKEAKEKSDLRDLFQQKTREKASNEVATAKSKLNLRYTSLLEELGTNYNRSINSFQKEAKAAESRFSERKFEFERAPCVTDECAKIEDMMRLLASCSSKDQCEISQRFFRGVTYARGQKVSPYLSYPTLWPLEQKLAATRERLRAIVVHLYHSEYPSIPDADRIQSDFLRKDHQFKDLIYQWVRELYVQLLEEDLLAPADRPQAGDPEELVRLGKVKVLGTLLLDRHPYLTPDSRRALLRIFSEERSIYDWLDRVGANQRVIDQLHGNLLPALYKPVFVALAYLNKVERQSVPYQSIKDVDYKRFAHYSKPRQQKGIQIVELLPVSRDDLVSMSINEGGVVAKIAGQVEGAAAYDMNQLQTVMRNAELLRGQFNDASSGQESGPKILNGIEDLSDDRSISQAKSLRDLRKLGQGAGLSGYSLGATAQGSVYGRARAALAYSRRREYLDAVITSAGRGDNFAKWVIRPSDLRSELAQKVGKKFVAAAHNGFPNGDQPFHMLVKVPRGAIHTDWGGRKYIYFNSSYSATGRQSFWKDIGVLGALIKVPFTVINHNAWHKLEEHMVTAVYPFMWNVTTSGDNISQLIRPKQMPVLGGNEREMLALGRTANALGGEIPLDDTDKIRYSEIRTLLDAEADFIQLTRTAQLSDLSTTMEAVKGESSGFRTNVIKSLQERVNAVGELQKSQAETAKLREKQTELETKLQKLQDDLKALQQGK